MINVMIKNQKNGKSAMRVIKCEKLNNKWHGKWRKKAEILYNGKYNCRNGKEMNRRVQQIDRK